MEGLVALGTVAAFAAFIWAVIRADIRDQAAYEEWFDDPRHVWNQHGQSTERPAP